MSATLTPDPVGTPGPQGPGTRADALTLAARNAWALTPFGRGIEPQSPLPSTVVHDAPHCTVRRYSAPGAVGTPVLLVPPLAVSIDCYDLRPGQSLAAHLVDAGRPVYVVDYGRIRRGDRAMGFDDWFAGIIPAAIKAVLGDAGRGAAARETGAGRVHDGGPLDGHTSDAAGDADRGTADGGTAGGGTAGGGTAGGGTAGGGAAGGGAADRVDLVAWSLGGTLSLLTAAHTPTLPIRSIVAMGTPIDYAKNPSIAPLRRLGSLAPMPVVGGVVHAAGGIPSPLVKLSYRSTALTRELTRPWFIASNLTDTSALAQMEAIDRFMAGMPGYPARFYTQMHKRLIMDNALASGTVRMGGRTVDLGALRVPVLSLAGGADVLAPHDCVAAVTGVLTGAPSVRVETVPGSHLGMVSGSGAPDNTWPVIDRFHEDLGRR